MSTTTTMTKVEKGNELALSLDAAAEQLKQAWLTEGNFARTIAYGLAVGKMRDALDDKVMRSLVKLKNTKMGFRTDESAQNVYSVEVVRDCIIEAVTLGLQCTGNMFNIIGGNMYVTKEGFTYLLRELARSGQLRGMKFVFHPAEITESSTQGTRRDGSLYQKIEREGRAKVDVCWVFNGVEGSEQLEFCIRVNAGMSQDAVIGKAERKAKAWLFNHLTDQAVSDGELEPAEPVMREVESKVQEPSFLKAAQSAGPVALPGGKEQGFKPNWLRQEGGPSSLDERTSSCYAEAPGLRNSGPSVEDEIPGQEPVADALPMFGEEVN